VPNLSAASVLPDGRAVLVIDTDDLIRSSLNHDHQESLANTVPVDRAGARPPHVLIVDDSPTVRAMERELFNSAGFEVTTAVDGMDAWGSLRERDFDLVVTDIDMPRLDGIGLIRSIRQEIRHKRTPIIVMSYRASSEERQRGLSAGADVYMIKADYDDQSLLETAQRLLGL
jgi:two-component system sensor histidine kinase and response regulator WspE